MVLKKEDSWWMSFDFRALNKLTVKYKFLILVINILLDELQGDNIFTKVDIHLVYHQIRMKQVNIPKINLYTHVVHYELLVKYFFICWSIEFSNICEQDLITFPPKIYDHIFI